MWEYNHLDSYKWDGGGEQRDGFHGRTWGREVCGSPLAWS